MNNKCPYCNGECCYLDRREGTTRYAQILTHGKGIHFCKYCEDGTNTDWYNCAKCEGGYEDQECSCDEQNENH